MRRYGWLGAVRAAAATERVQRVVALSRRDHPRCGTSLCGDDPFGAFTGFVVDLGPAVEAPSLQDVPDPAVEEDCAETGRTADDEDLPDEEDQVGEVRDHAAAASALIGQSS